MHIQFLCFSSLPILASPTQVQARVFPVHLGYHDAERAWRLLVCQQNSPHVILVHFPIAIDDVVAAIFLHLAQVFPHALVVLPEAAGHGQSAVQLHVEELSSLSFMRTCA